MRHLSLSDATRSTRSALPTHARWALAIVAAAALSACGSDDDIEASAPTPAQPVAVGDTVALTTSGKLISFDRATPATLVGSIAVTGLSAGETLLGIDHRPADALLYAVSSLGRLYTLAPSTGVATFKVALAAAAGDDDPYTALAGTAFGLDFNPVADRLRLVSDTGQNLRINVDTGAVITDGAINGAQATVTAAAYTNAVAGTTSTQLYDLDSASASGQLYLQAPPNDGTLGGAVPLGVSVAAANGFDIDARNNVGYAALTVGGSTALYTVPLTAGTAAVLVGTIGTGEALSGLALVQPASVQVVALGADGTLSGFDAAAPGTLTTSVPIGGLAAGETVLGIDRRPADGKLYALTSNARVLTVDTATGASTAVSTLSADPADATAPYAGLIGTRFSVDFNPVADRLRVIGDTGASLRINVATGATTTDGDINRPGAAASVAAAAYGSSFAGATATVLYDLDAATAVLAQQTPPNNGTLVDVGPLGIALTNGAALDIAGGGNGIVLAAVPAVAGGPSTLYTVSLTTGAAGLYRNTGGDATASLIGGASGPSVIDIAIGL